MSQNTRNVFQFGSKFRIFQLAYPVNLPSFCALLFPLHICANGTEANYCTPLYHHSCCYKELYTNNRYNSSTWIENPHGQRFVWTMLSLSKLWSSEGNTCTWSSSNREPNLASCTFFLGVPLHCFLHSKLLL